MDALYFKTYFCNALQKGIQKLENQILDDKNTDLAHAKFTTGQLAALRQIHKSMEDFFQECLNTSRKAVNGEVLGEFLSMKVGEFQNAHKEAILSGNYESINQRSTLQGLYNGFTSIVHSVGGLLQECEATLKSPASAPTDDNASSEGGQ